MVTNLKRKKCHGILKTHAISLEKKKLINFESTLKKMLLIFFSFF
jgi:hypothetical protein